jgi:1-phosphatidylinositol-4-phosphate 5-kinase
MVPTLAASATSPASPTASDSEAAFQNSLARQAEEIRKERAERRRQNAEQDRHAPQRLVVKGNPIDDGHSSWLLMFNMLTGIRVAVSRCEAKVKRPLTKADYKATTKFSFDTLGNELTPSVGHDFKFKVRSERDLACHAHLAHRIMHLGYFATSASNSVSTRPIISSP